MRSDMDVAKEALRRADNLRKRKTERKRRVFGIYSVAACLMILVALSFAMPAIGGGAAMQEGLYIGSIFANASVGGYLIIGIIGFILGAAVVIFFNKSKKG